ncbi:hypothetical protein DNU06_12790 [Putridiphycobacter roseus]|uniref:Nitrogen fixation protein FixH n=1 Tax=Putridiphycobacter roseus TaxID=2219161 RepID=A0A2W1N0G7_9FLAO|nr:FixH family protein [Putridiphycobacter roseus]PZE16421.1 hypothetical protein DNU06_12790 [Putridiphycobacter roseus]
MKFNWGHGITLAILAFMTFIIYIVVQTFQLNADLVQDDFYEAETQFDENKLAKENYISLQDPIHISQKPEGIIFEFPKNLKNIAGTILFYRRDNKSLDKLFDIKLNPFQQQSLDYTHFQKGVYDIKINFKNNQKAYSYQEKIAF